MSSDIRIGGYSVSVTRRIAEGGFGFVDLVHSKQAKQDFALKRCGIVQPESLEIVKKEVNVLKKFAGITIIAIAIAIAVVVIIIIIIIFIFIIFIIIIIIISIIIIIICIIIIIISSSISTIIVSLQCISIFCMY